MLFVTEELTKNQLFYNTPYVAKICINLFQTSFAHNEYESDIKEIQCITLHRTSSNEAKCF